ncbi:hypothetical protein FRC11_005681 [Ceratobasidium sp. 423]|nr:hypothetical protein FRC11_005681 [Ceratobasidium sp. 423]
MSSQQSNTAANRALVNWVTEISKGIESLNARITSLELDKSTLRGRVEALEEANENTEKATCQMAADLNAQKYHIDYLQNLLLISNAATHMKLPPDLLDDDVDANLDDPNLATDDTDTITLTVDESKIQQDWALKRAVYKSLCQMCGVPHLCDLHYMAFPPVDEEHPDWPLTINERNERCPYMRLDYSQPIDEPKNWAQLNAWANYTMNHGASVSPEAAKVLSRLSIKQIKTACLLRFRYLHKDFRKKLREAEGAPAEPIGNNIPIDPVIQQLDATPNAGATLPHPITPIPELCSQAKGKCKLRAAKREKLTGEATKFQEPKYDSYFLPGPMSDDEDKYNLVDGTWVKVPNLFESREFEFVSDEMRQCCDAVDAIPNPSEKSRPTPRIHGPPKPGPPHKASTIPWALRAWMIKPTFLATNTWLNDGLVLSNGVAWGDPSEPTLPKSQHKSNKCRRVEENQAGPSNALVDKARQARHLMEEAQRQAQELQGQPDGTGNASGMED